MSWVGGHSRSDHGLAVGWSSTTNENGVSERRWRLGSRTLASMSSSPPFHAPLSVSERPWMLNASPTEVARDRSLCWVFSPFLRLVSRLFTL